MAIPKTFDEAFDHVRQLDELVYELYGITDEERRLVEANKT